MQEEYDLLGQVIKEARIAAGLTREQLGGKINVSPSTLFAIATASSQSVHQSVPKIKFRILNTITSIFHNGFEGNGRNEIEGFFSMINLDQF